jgi:hypothetical protein
LSVSQVSTTNKTSNLSVARRHLKQLKFLTKLLALIKIHRSSVQVWLVEWSSAGSEMEFPITENRFPESNASLEVHSADDPSLA